MTANHRTTFRSISLLVVLCFSPVAAQTLQNPGPPNKLVQFQMVLLKRGPKWSAVDDRNPTELMKNHRAYAFGLVQSGKAAMVGKFQDDGDILGVYILRSAKADEAKSWAMSDPAVAAGYFEIEMHPWWAEDVIKPMSTPVKLSTAYFAFLTRGPAWTPVSTPETEELQRQHLANIRRLANMKKLVWAGPFGDNGTLRGIFVFKVDSLDEAKNLAATDPAVKAGRLALDIHPLLVPDGILP